MVACIHVCTCSLLSHAFITEGAPPVFLTRAPILMTATLIHFFSRFDGVGRSFTAGKRAPENEMEAGVKRSQICYLCGTVRNKNL